MSKPDRLPRAAGVSRPVGSPSSAGRSSRTTRSAYQGRRISSRLPARIARKITPVARRRACEGAHERADLFDTGGVETRRRVGFGLNERLDELRLFFGELERIVGILFDADFRKSGAADLQERLGPGPTDVLVVVRVRAVDRRLVALASRTPRRDLPDASVTMLPGQHLSKIVAAAGRRTRRGA